MTRMSELQIERLTTDHLRLIAKHLRELPPSARGDNDFVTYGMSTEVLRFFFKDSWTNENVFSMSPVENRLNRLGRSYLKTDEQDEAAAYRHQQRVLRLAETVFNLQGCDGLDGIIKTIKAGNLESAIAELEWADHLFRRGITFRFVPPVGSKGENFDYEIFLPDGSSTYVEVACKPEQTSLSLKTIAHALEMSRKQLPKGKQGLIFMSIPENWIKDAAIAPIISNAFQQCFRNTSRVVAIGVRWEEWYRRLDGAQLILNKYDVNVNTHHPLSLEMDSLLRRIEGNAMVQGVSFRDIAQTSVLILRP